MSRGASLTPAKFGRFGIFWRGVPFPQPLYRGKLDDDDGLRWWPAFRNVGSSAATELAPPYAMVWTIPPSARNAAPLVADASFEAT
jgi:hypothetical protein